MYPKTQQHEKQKAGSHCHICMGCGRCPGVEKGVSVVMKQDIFSETGPIVSSRGERLVTVDIGTTTIAMQLYGRDGRVQDSFAAVNPQTKYGADVLSRIQAAEDPVAAKDMRNAVRQVLRQGFCRFGEQLFDKESLSAVIAANTTMVYFLLGYDTKELGQAPFSASRLEAVSTLIEEVPCVVFPGLSAFVGGDIGAGILACGMTESEELTLLIDLGTNGEMVLGNRNRLMACATAAGPAFEGGVNRGIWGADMISLLAGMRREGILDETGLITEEYFDTGVRIGDVCVTQASVRAVQLAKGAIAAGIRILTKAYGVTGADIKKVVLAGGFGYYLDPAAAAMIGILPEELAEKTVTGGNTALAGALLLGKSLLAAPEEKEFLAKDLGRKQKNLTEIVNLAQYPGFEELYLQSMELRPMRLEESNCIKNR